MPNSHAEEGSGLVIPKPSQDAVDRFRRLLAEEPRASLKPMFGNLAAFANGYLFAGLFGPSVFVRLDAAGEASVVGQGGQPFAPMPGRPMRGYVVLPDVWSQDDVKLRSILDVGLAYVLGLPPKPPKAPRRAKGPKA